MTIALVRLLTAARQRVWLNACARFPPDSFDRFPSASSQKSAALPFSSLQPTPPTCCPLAMLYTPLMLVSPSFLPVSCSSHDCCTAPSPIPARR